MDSSMLTRAGQIVADYWPYISIVVLPAVSTTIYAYLRRPKSTGNIGQFFTEKKLLSPPMARPAYSDRMAYVLAEMSDLAYYQFEGHGDLVDDAVNNLQSLNLTVDADIRKFLESFSVDLMSERRLSLQFLKNILKNSGFKLLDIINVMETQGFACKRNVPNEPPYLVLSFRGTEKKISDWLTDARCVPTAMGKAKVHTGFLEAFTKNKNAVGKTVKEVSLLQDSSGSRFFKVRGKRGYEGRGTSLFSVVS